MASWHKNQPFFNVVQKVPYVKPKVDVCLGFLELSSVSRSWWDIQWCIKQVCKLVVLYWHAEHINFIWELFQNCFKISSLNKSKYTYTILKLFSLLKVIWTLLFLDDPREIHRVTYECLIDNCAVYMSWQYCYIDQDWLICATETKDDK